MALPTALIAKGLAGLGIVAAGTTGLVFILNRDPNKEINDKIKKLGIDESCYFKDNKTTKSCNLDKAKLEKVKFNKGGTDLTATGGDISAELTIEKLTDDDFPEGLRFTLKHNKETDLDIGTNNNKITLKKNIDYDFKIKTADDKSLKLEKTWTPETLTAKLGITGCVTSSKDCTLPTSINVSFANNDKTEGATISESNKKIKYEEDKEGYNQGIKFCVDTEVALSGGNPAVSNKKIETSTSGVSYEIKKIEGKWYLAKKN